MPTAKQLWSCDCLTCSVCGVQHVVQAENLRKRLNNYKSLIRNFHPRQNTIGLHADGTKVYRHFSLPGHDLTNMKVTILQHVAESSSSSAVECKWIWTSETITPMGLNVEDGFSSEASAFVQFHRQPFNSVVVPL